MLTQCNADLEVLKFDSAGTQREYVAFIPKAASPTGLIIALHGAGMTGPHMCEFSVRASDLVSTTGAVVVCPTSTQGSDPSAFGKGKRQLRGLDGRNEALMKMSNDVHEKQVGRMLQKEDWVQFENCTWYNTKTGETFNEENDAKNGKCKSDKKADDKGEAAQNSWKAFPGFDDADDVNFLADLIQYFKVEHKIPAGRVIMVGFSNGVSMAHRFSCEKPDLIDGLVAAEFVWTDPWQPFAASKPPYRQCEAANLTKKIPFYTVCGTEDVYCKAMDFLGNWRDYSIGVLGCEGSQIFQVGYFPDHPPGPMTCYGYESCPGMNTACSISGHQHTGTSADDAVHYAFGAFFNLTLKPLPPAPRWTKAEMKGVESEKNDVERATTSSPSTSVTVDASAKNANSSFVAFLSGVTAVVVFANWVVAVLG